MKVKVFGKKQKVSLISVSKYVLKQTFKACAIPTVFFLIMGVVSTVLSALYPKIFSSIIDVLSGGDFSAENLRTFWILLSFIIVIEVVSFIRSEQDRVYATKHFNLKVTVEFEKLYTAKVNSTKLAYFYSKQYQDDKRMIYEVISSDRMWEFMRSFTEIAFSVVGLAVSVYVLMDISLWFGLFAAGALILLLFGNLLWARADYTLDEKNQIVYRKMERYQEVVKGQGSIRELRGHNAVKTYINKWRFFFKQSVDLNKKRWKQERYLSLYSALIDTFVTVAQMVIAILLIRSGQLNVAGFVGLTLAVSNMMRSTEQFAGGFGRLSKSAVRIAKFKAFMEADVSEKENRDVEPESFRSLEFKGVSFSYKNPFNAKEEQAEIKDKGEDKQEKDDKKDKPDKIVLQDLNLKINKGDKIAFVGENGSGKTTLFKLIGKFWDPSDGQILFNGKPLDDANLAEYRKLFSVINQDYVKYQWAASLNVSISNPEDSGEESVRADIKLAQGDDILKRLDKAKGLDTFLSREFEGVLLSGGQEQKLAIARGLHKRDAEVYLVDEPTSAIDPIAEEKILNNILKATKNKTLLVISHRLSLCTKMDKIGYLENGRLVEFGSHTELMKKNGKYAKLFNLQAKWYKEKAE